jgi:predicted ATP-grasp superfamily ATP-dependent carboligase
VSPALTIVGASARAAVCSAVRAGFSVHAADLFADADLRQVCPAIRVRDYPADLVAALDGSHSGGWMYTGALENYPATVERFAHVRRLLGNSAAVLRRVRQPRLVADVLRRWGLPCPEVVVDGGPLRGTATWLRKPLCSAGGAHISLCQRRAAVDLEAGPAGGYYFQQFIDGLPCSAAYVAAGGQATLLGVTQQLIGSPWAGAHGFQYCGSIGPLATPPRVTRNFAAIGTALASHFDLAGLFGVDAIVNAEGVWPVEVNPRYTASIELLERAAGIRAIELHVAACERGDLPAYCAGTFERQYGKAILFALRRLTVPPSFSSPIDRGDDRTPPVLADIPDAGTTIEAGWPIVTVVGEGADQRDVLEMLQAMSARIRAVLAE